MISKFNKEHPHAVQHPTCNEKHMFCGGCLKSIHIDIYPLCPDCTNVPDNKTVNKKLVFCLKKPKIVSYKPLAQMSGWISLDGKYYPCGNSEHEALGIMIARENKWEKLEYRGDLTEKGWARISDNGYLITKDYQIPQPQYDTIFDILCLWPKNDRNRETLECFFQLLLIQ